MTRTWQHQSAVHHPLALSSCFLSCCFSSFHSFSTLASTKSLEAYSQRMSCWSGHADNTTTFHAKGAWNVSAAKAADEESNRVCSKSSWTFRSPDPLHDDTHEYIADALQQMSLQDRDKVYHEVHGVGEVIEETPEFLKPSFVELQNELQLLIVGYMKNPHKLSSSNIQCDAFLKAQAQDHGYVHSPFHYKAFLRAERFDAKQAAIRMIRFFDTKAWCFGPIMSDDRYLSQDITQNMLSPEDMAVLRRGFNRVMTGRDRSGRCLYLNLPHLTHFESPESLARCYLYDAWSMAQDEETQKRGLALICFESGDHERPPFDVRMVPTAVRGIMAIPVRYVVFHHCFSDERYRFILQMGLRLLSQDLRARTKLHFGTPLECMYDLMGFGIMNKTLPFDLHGQPKMKPQLDWIKMRAIQENMIREGKLRALSQMRGFQEDEIGGKSSHQSQLSVIVVPASVDILLGRGGEKINSHPGNIELHRLVGDVVADYEAGSKPQKTAISQSLVQKVKDEIGGRFLKQDPTSRIWLVTDDETARLKISHLFRSRRDVVVKKKKKFDDFDKKKADRPASSTKRVRVSDASSTSS